MGTSQSISAGKLAPDTPPRKRWGAGKEQLLDSGVKERIPSAVEKRIAEGQDRCSRAAHGRAFPARTGRDDI
jgi:hypothetical protein